MRRSILNTCFVLALFAASAGSEAQAEIVSTERAWKRAVAGEAFAQERIFTLRHELRRRLERTGIKSDEANARIAALLDHEIARVSSVLHRLPAGGEQPPDSERPKR